MKNKVALFDIDYTLFDTDKFRDLTYPTLMHLLEQEDTPEYHKQVKEVERKLIQEGGYEPVTFAHTLAEVFHIPPKRKEIEDLFLNNDSYKNYLYPESKEVLEILSKKENMTLGIVSKGETSFQERKIYSLLSFFKKEHIHISVDKVAIIDEILTQYADNELYVIDDSVIFLHSIQKQQKSVHTILVAKENRYEKREAPQDFHPDTMIQSLKEILEIFDKS